MSWGLYSGRFGICEGFRGSGSLGWLASPNHAPSAPRDPKPPDVANGDLIGRPWHESPRHTSQAATHLGRFPPPDPYERTYPAVSGRLEQTMGAGEVSIGGIEEGESESRPYVGSRLPTQ